MNPRKRKEPPADCPFLCLPGDVLRLLCEIAEKTVGLKQTARLYQILLHSNKTTMQMARTCLQRLGLEMACLKPLIKLSILSCVICNDCKRHPAFHSTTRVSIFLAEAMGWPMEYPVMPLSLAMGLCAVCMLKRLGGARCFQMSDHLPALWRLGDISHPNDKAEAYSLCFSLAITEMDPQMNEFIRMIPLLGKMPLSGVFRFYSRDMLIRKEIQLVDQHIEELKVAKGEDRDIQLARYKYQIRPELVRELQFS